MKIDLTNLTAHPDWVQLVALFNLLEKNAVDRLKSQEDADANRELIVLNRIRSAISDRSQTPHIWKVYGTHGRTE